MSPQHTLCHPSPLTQIEKVDLRDEGIYTCAATSLAGESKRDVTLKVLGKDKGAGWWVIPWGPLGLPWGARGGERNGILKTLHVLVAFIPGFACPIHLWVRSRPGVCRHIPVLSFFHGCPAFCFSTGVGTGVVPVIPLPQRSQPNDFVLVRVQECGSSVRGHEPSRAFIAWTL